MTEDHGHRTENALRDICVMMFGADFVLASPSVVEAKNTQECADILVILDDTLLIVQAKSIDIDVTDLDDVGFGRIKKRHTTAKTQLNRTLNARRNKKLMQVKGKSVAGVEIQIDWESIEQIIGIVTLNLPDKLYDNPEFRFQYPDLFSIQREIDVHTFVLNDLSQASLELTTPEDVLLYLAARKSILLPGKLIVGSNFASQAFNELDLLALYKTNYPLLQEIIEKPGDYLILSPGLWEGFRKGNRESIERRDRLLMPGLIVDKIMESIRHSVSPDNIMENDQSASTYLSLDILRKLAKLSRVERAEIGRQIGARLKKSTAEPFQYYPYISEKYRVAFCFVVLNIAELQFRLNALHLFAHEACHALDVDYVVCVGVNGLACEAQFCHWILLDAKRVRASVARHPILRFFGQKRSIKMSEWA